MIIHGKDLGKVAFASLTINEGETVAVEEPFSYDPVPRELSEKLGEYTLPPASVHVLRHATLLGPIGVVLTAENDVVLDAGFSGRLDVFERHKRFFSMALSVVETEKPSFVGFAHSMIGVWAINYFHWHTEFLAALDGVMQVSPDALPVMLLHPQAPRFAEETLDLLGVRHKRIQSPHIKARELVVPTTRRWNGRTSPRAISSLRDRFLKKCGGGSIRSVYISRKNAEERHIVNEKELWERLKALRFRRYYLEDLSFDEQFRLFYNADHIVAAHGAGLTNAIYAGWKPTVLEIFGDYVNPCYFTIFSSMGMPYGFVRGEQEGKHIRVDVDKVIRTHHELRNIQARM